MAHNGDYLKIPIICYCQKDKFGLLMSIIWRFLVAPDKSWRIWPPSHWPFPALPQVVCALTCSTSWLRLRMSKSRKETPQKLTQLSSRSHPRHLVGKRTAQKDITIDTTSDSQVNSNFPNRWSPASLTFNNYFYLFLYLYIT